MASTMADMKTYLANSRVKTAISAKLTTEKVVEKFIMEKINGMSTADILKDCKIEVTAEVVQKFEHVYPFDLLVNIFCSFDKHFDVDYVKNEFSKLGISVLHGHRMYQYFERLKDLCLY